MSVVYVDSKERNFKNSLDLNLKKEKRKVETPKVPQPRLAGLLALKTPAKKKEDILEESAADRQAVKDFVEQISEVMESWVVHYFSIRYADEAERVSLRKESVEAVEQIQRLLEAGGDPDLQKHARVAYALALVRSCPNTIFALKEVQYGFRASNGMAELPGLINVKLGGVDPVLKSASEKDHGAFQVLRRFFVVRGLRGEDRDFVAKRLVELSVAVVKRMEDERAEYEERVRKDAKDGAEAELLAGKAGTYLIHIPDEHRRGQNLRGGLVAVGSDGKEVRIVRAAGGVYKRAQQLMGVFIPLRTLGEAEFQLNYFEKNQDLYKAKWGLHDLLRRGIAAWEEEKERKAKVADFQGKADASRTALAERATVSEEEWLVDGKDGSAVVYYGRRPWEVMSADGKITRFFEVSCLVERREDSHIRLVALPEFPENLKELFAGDEIRGWHHPGENYMKSTWPLGSFLRKCAGMARGRRQRGQTVAS